AHRAGQHVVAIGAEYAILDQDIPDLARVGGVAAVHADPAAAFVAGEMRAVGVARVRPEADADDGGIGQLVVADGLVGAGAQLGARATAPGRGDRALGGRTAAPEVEPLVPDPTGAQQQPVGLVLAGLRIGCGDGAEGADAAARRLRVRADFRIARQVDLPVAVVALLGIDVDQAAVGGRGQAGPAVAILWRQLEVDDGDRVGRARRGWSQGEGKDE